jgi:hypothetical protein
MALRMQWFVGSTTLLGLLAFALAAGAGWFDA